MKSLLDALVGKFDSSPTLTSLFPGGLFLSLAPTDQGLPVCVLTVISAVPTYTTCSSTTPFNVQFAVFADSDTSALDAIEEIKQVFDDADIGMHCLRTNEGITCPDEKTFTSIVSYSILVSE